MNVNRITFELIRRLILTCIGVIRYPLIMNGD